MKSVRNLLFVLLTGSFLFSNAAFATLDAKVSDEKFESGVAALIHGVVDYAVDELVDQLKKEYPSASFEFESSLEELKFTNVPSYKLDSLLDILYHSPIVMFVNVDE